MECWMVAMPSYSFFVSNESIPTGKCVASRCQTFLFPFSCFPILGRRHMCWALYCTPSRVAYYDRTIFIYLLHSYGLLKTHRSLKTLQIFEYASLSSSGERTSKHLLLFLYAHTPHTEWREMAWETREMEIGPCKVFGFYLPEITSVEVAVRCKTEQTRCDMVEGDATCEIGLPTATLLWDDSWLPCWHLPHFIHIILGARKMWFYFHRLCQPHANKLQK